MSNNRGSYDDFYVEDDEVLETPKERLAREKREAYESLSSDQKSAVDIINKNVKDKQRDAFFMTGPAGSGKSFVIDYLQAFCGPATVTATTGAAAQLIGGRTFHSVVGWTPKNPFVDFTKFIRNLKEDRLMIVDEISMLDSKLFDQLMDFQETCPSPFTLLLVGDFMQLPPVKAEACFTALSWDRVSPLFLTVQHRQQDEEFIAALDDVRRGCRSKRVNMLLKGCSIPVLPVNKDVTILASHNDKVEWENQNRLNRLDGQEHVYAAQVISTWPEYPSRARFMEKLRLKEGARVVLLTNQYVYPDSRYGGDIEVVWVNGSTGKVIGLPKPNQKDTIRVLLDNDDEVEVGRAEETIYAGDGKTTHVIRQFPMKLAWSLTIHKSQGMTLDNVVVDLGGHFAPGQTYVALSRVRTKEGLKVYGSLRSLNVDENCLIESGLQPSFEEEVDYSKVSF